MPKASRSTASDSVQLEGYEGHFENFEGGYTSASRRTPPTPTSRRCSPGSPTTGVSAPIGAMSSRGRVTFTSADGEETFETGDAYYVAPGHTPILFAGTEVVEFSPTAELQETLTVVERNMGAGG